MTIRSHPVTLSDGGAGRGILSTFARRRAHLSRSLIRRLRWHRHRLRRDLVAAELLDRCGDRGYGSGRATLAVDPVEPTLATSPFWWRSGRALQTTLAWGCGLVESLRREGPGASA